MVIKIDMDGVVRDIYTTMCNRYNRVFGTSMKPSDIFSYAICDSFPKIHEELGVDCPNWFFNGAFGESLFLNSPIYEGAKEAMDLLTENGHKVVICTYQKNEANKIATIKFLEKHGVQYDSICFTHDKWLVNGDVMIDDCKDFLEDEREGAKTKIKINRAFNSDVKCDLSFNSLIEAAKFIVENAHTLV